jgi:uncharacterized protein (TIGR02757 family)
MGKQLLDLREFLEAKVVQYNTPEFIEHDPVQIPHRYSLKEDIEIAGLLTATISWGNRASILRSANRMMDLMGNSPHDFVVSHKPRHLERLEGFVHRTFHAPDFASFIGFFRHLYTRKDGIEGIFNRYRTATSLQPAIHQFKKEFLSLPHLPRTRKHLPDPLSGSAAKRMNMFLRWMVRKDQAGVDFGIWTQIPPSILSCPLDVHTGHAARYLGLLNRPRNDARAVAELDTALRAFDPGDPVKYDYALFGLGIHEKAAMATFSTGP